LFRNQLLVSLVFFLHLHKRVIYLKYRSEIDGLRALAVVPVILFHAGYELFSGGFIGVDVFFVISGYLITLLLVEDIENKRFSILHFYERRVRRILPALFFIMFICIPFAWMWMLPSQMLDFSQSLIAVSLFVSNILFWRESGYFDAHNEEKPLLHTWSLAVEEQFYILFPILIILAWRFGKNRVFWMIILMAAISLMLTEWGWRNKPVPNFYLAPSRAWELFAGAIVAFIVQKRGVQKNNSMALLGLGAILFSIFFYDKTIPFPSLYTIIPVIGVVFMLMYADKGTLVAKLLSNKVIVGIGLISYSAYLWHQPLLAFARIKYSGEPSKTLIASLVVGSIVLAYFSWRYIEKPFRSKNKIKSNRIWTFSLISLIIFIMFGFIGVKENGYALQRYDEDFISKRDIGFIRSKRYSELGNPNVKPEWILLGDSHADSLQEAFSQLLNKYKESALVSTKAGCPPSLNLWRHDMDFKMECHDNSMGAIDTIKKEGIKNALISARFALYINSSRFDNTVGGIEKGPTDAVIFDHIDFKDSLREKSARAHAIEEEIVNYVGTLANEGINIFIFTSIPEFGWKVPSRLLNMQKTSIPRIAFDERSKSLKSLYNRLSKIKNVVLLRTEGFFCSKTECFSTIDDKPLFYDSNHPSKLGAEKLLEYFEPSLMRQKNNKNFDI